MDIEKIIEKKIDVNIQGVYGLFATLSLLLVLLLASCTYNSKNDFEVTNFTAITNYQEGLNEKSILVDFDSAIYNGFVIPSKKETKSGAFGLSFKIKNTSGKPQQFFYKIFYQNESYKFPEEHPFANENFYGSWKATQTTFRPTLEIPVNDILTVRDSFSIVGNPRNEKQFYGSKLRDIISEEVLQLKIKEIKANAEWLASIKQKAIINHNSP